MELFMKVYFYVAIVNVVLILITIATAKYPKKREDSLGSDIVKLFIGTGFLVWCAYLLYFAN